MFSRVLGEKMFLNGNEGGQRNFELNLESSESINEVLGSKNFLFPSRSF